MTLETMTPVEVDTALAALHSQLGQALDGAEAMAKAIKRHETEVDRRAAKGWPSDPLGAERVQRLRDEEQRLRDLAADLNLQTYPYDEEYARRGYWPRYFHVPGGHVHSSMRCPTCNRNGSRTTFGWLLEWSGRSEAETLEALVMRSAQTVLCTVCFPSAPVEWTKPRQEDGVCAGSTKPRDPNGRARMGFAAGNWATCAVCQTRQTVSRNGTIRKHKTPTE